MVLVRACIAFTLVGNVFGLKRPTASESSASPAIAVRLVRSTRLIGGLSFFVGRIAVGDDESQHFEVLFDTASGNVILPSSSCTSAACSEHQHYHSKDGKTAGKVEIEFSQMELGNGIASGSVVREKLCVGRMISGEEARGRSACAEDLEVVAAKNMTDVPFRAMPHDGIVGLGLDELWVGPKSSFLGQLVSSINGLSPQFSLAFGTNEGELRLGGYDPTRLTAPLEWFPVAHEDEGFWQVWVQAVRVGNSTIDACLSGCRAIIDTGASGMAVPKALLPRLRAALAPVPVAGGGCNGPDLHVDLGSTTTLRLKASDYVGPACEPQLVPFDLGEARFANVFVFGVNVLRPYYTVFDWGAKRIGFSRAIGRFVRIGESESPDDVGGLASNNLMMV